MISGKFKEQFKYANIAIMTDVSAEESEDFDIERVTDKEVTLHGGIVREIHRNKDGSEYIIMDKKGVYEQIFKGGKPSKVKCEPFLDQYNTYQFTPEIEPPKEITPKKLTKKQLEKLHNTSTWHATCSECGCKKMDYTSSTFTYHCPKCGNTLEV